ncbi:sulfolactaldehyde 3-reductase [Vibrio gazogenes]|uniref:4-hydroxybutyrate dehydrogenase / sulfolactaldehyde 3-reductase n=1 Tax=Vibrio gazogenes DSM 21264 = NBRC 103151 TaxID=1123492 RepID=A0A1M5BX32_VIBGA|nr:sulfolactaldehyde 3-reductase [Vibrio gazogenes]USP13622.1 sulfolactaldehyde 3-reductase [Vibrio gazogenes]SHF46867.1 4-hydroxybutyrate dehydrogenase / sulfolactaldehyde 3-reductase [Vibrio gazogenes DSM 21264] [Vibrio gazogenes DSM 21264 = NBRC 103151]SJN55664.1 2-(hydroxymethyl)glutarate dehydrogenase [Vibrio gazogenes]
MSAIGFIGLGQMGMPMALNLLKGGHSLKVFDINEAAVRQLVTQGATAATSPADAALNAEFVVTMLPNGTLVKNVLFGEDGVVSTLDKNALVIDMSTIHPLETDALIQTMFDQGFAMMEAPVGRTSEHAVRGELLIMAGGTKAQIERAQPLFDCMGSETIDAGGAGKGIRVKIINNYMSIALNALSAEAATLAEAIGLDWDTAMQVMSGTPAGKGHFTTTWPGKVLAGDLSPVFMIDLAHKDLGIALDLANQVHVPMPCGAASRELYSAARAAGRGRQDWTAVLEQLRVTSGLAAKVK